VLYRFVGTAGLMSRILDDTLSVWTLFSSLNVNSSEFRFRSNVP
jgi:hypothetical protein